jgi:hypothetical protein
MGPTRSPKTGLAHRSVGCLPLEVDPARLLAFLDEPLPDEIQHAKLDPPLERPVYRGVVRELSFGQSVPLAAASHPEDDRLQSGTLVYARTTGVLWWIVFLEDRFDDLPQLVGYSPDGEKGLLLGGFSDIAGGPHSVGITSDDSRS